MESPTPNQSTLRVTLVAWEIELEYAWKDAFSGVAEVEVVPGSILTRSGDALVSPANSFGYMDGGLDLLISERFGWDLEKRVRERILTAHCGELLVGEALVVETNDPAIPWLISAPTMRVPMRVENTVNAFLAFRAVLRTARAHPAIEHVLCPGLGTGEGRMDPKTCARQMRRAWDAVVRGELVRLGGLAGAVRHHLELLGQDPGG